jgi:hypothetical protein
MYPFGNLGREPDNFQRSALIIDDCAVRSEPPLVCVIVKPKLRIKLTLSVDSGLDGILNSSSVSRVYLL